MFYQYFQKIYSFIDGLKYKKINISKNLMNKEIYNYEEAENFDEYNRIVSFSDKEFWYCIGIKTEEDTYILHTKTNIVFSKNLKLIGKVLQEDGKLWLVEVEDMEQKMVDWYYKCFDKTYQEIRTNSENENEIV